MNAKEKFAVGKGEVCFCCDYFQKLIRRKFCLFFLNFQTFKLIPQSCLIIKSSISIKSLLSALEKYNLKKNLFIYFWLRWVFAAACGLSLVAASGGYSCLLCVGFSLRWLPLLQSTGSRCAVFSICGSQALQSRLSNCGARASHRGGFSCYRAWALGAWASVVVAHGLSCSAACGIFPELGSNSCPLLWQVDS